MTYAPYLTTTTNVLSCVVWLWITLLLVSCAPSSPSLTLPPPGSADAVDTSQLSNTINTLNTKIANMQRAMEAGSVEELQCIEKEVQQQYGATLPEAQRNCKNNANFDNLKNLLKDVIEMSCKDNYNPDTPVIDLSTVALTLVSAFRDGKKNFGNNLNEAIQQQQKNAATLRQQHNENLLDLNKAYITCKGGENSGRTTLVDGIFTQVSAANKVCDELNNQLFSKPACEDEPTDGAGENENQQNEEEENKQLPPSEGQ